MNKIEIKNRLLKPLFHVLTCLLPTMTLAEETTEGGMSYQTYYQAITDPTAQIQLQQSNDFIVKLNSVLGWGKTLLQYAYALTLGVAIIALVISIIRMIINSSNPQALEKVRHDLVINIIVLAACGVIGAICVLVLYLINIF